MYKRLFLVAGMCACTAAVSTDSLRGDAWTAATSCDELRARMSVSAPRTVSRATGLVFGNLDITASGLYDMPQVVTIRFMGGTSHDEAVIGMQCLMLRPATDLNLLAYTRKMNAEGRTVTIPVIALGSPKRLVEINGDIAVDVLVRVWDANHLMRIPGTGRWGSDVEFLAVVEPYV